MGFSPDLHSAYWSGAEGSQRWAGGTAGRAAAATVHWPTQGQPGKPGDARPACPAYPCERGHPLFPQVGKKFPSCVSDLIYSFFSNSTLSLSLSLSVSVSVFVSLCLSLSLCLSVSVSLSHLSLSLSLSLSSLSLSPLSLSLSLFKTVAGFRMGSLCLLGLATVSAVPVYHLAYDL